MAYNQNYSQRSNDRVRFDLMEHIGVLARKDNGWTKEVNIVAWNGGKAKVDIREWDPEHSRMTKGITLLEEEAETLAKSLARRYGLRYSDNGPQTEGMPAYASAQTEAAPVPAAMEDPAEAPAETQSAALAETQAAFDEQEEEIPFDEEDAEQS